MYIFILGVFILFLNKLKVAIAFYNQINRSLAISLLDDQQQKIIFQFYNEQPKKTFISLICHHQIYIYSIIYLIFTASCIDNFFSKILIHFTQDKADGANTGKRMNKVHFYLIWVLTTPFNEEESSISEQMKVLGFISKYKTNNISVE